jgi:hypothetical protein
VFLVVHELVLINTDSNMHGDKIKNVCMFWLMNSRLRTICRYGRDLVLDSTSYTWLRWLVANKTSFQSAAILSFYIQQKYYVYKQRIFYRICKTMRTWHYWLHHHKIAYLPCCYFSLLGTEKYSVGIVSRRTGLKFISGLVKMVKGSNIETRQKQTFIKIKQ